MFVIQDITKNEEWKASDMVEAMTLVDILRRLGRIVQMRDPLTSDIFTWVRS